jgi:hypothetical protein
MMVTMADSDALRQQRFRRHRSGDHSICRRNCKDSRPSLKIAPLPAGSGKDLDPAAALRDLACQLQAAYRVDPANAVLARELRSTLLVLLPAPNAGIDAELKALMGDLSRPERGDWPPGTPGNWDDDGG